MELRVLHVPDSVGGQAAGLARAERAIGLDSSAIALEPSRYGYAMDAVLKQPGQSRLRFELARYALIRRALRDSDVVHFNFGSTMLPGPPRGPASPRYRAYAKLLALRDLPLLARAGKVIAVTFQGDDVRQGDMLRARYAESVADANPGVYEAGDEAKRRIVTAFDRYAHLLYYLNPDLAWVLPDRARFLPYASVDLQEWDPVTSSGRSRPLVVHAPSERLTKGTTHVLGAVAELQRQGLRFDFELVEGVSQSEARAVLERADISIDQLQVGWYGAAAVEAMALAKPVVCFLRREDFVHLPPELVADLPLVEADRQTLTEHLRSLICMSDAERFELGEKGRRFVERWHDPCSIAQRVKADYEEQASRLIRRG